MIPQSLLIRVGACALALLGFTLLILWIDGKFEDAAQADILRKQIAANVEKQDEITARAEKAEADVLTEKEKYANLQRQWRKIRASENHSVCALDGDTIGLLREATRAAGVPAR